MAGMLGRRCSIGRNGGTSLHLWMEWCEIDATVFNFFDDLLMCQISAQTRKVQQSNVFEKTQCATIQCLRKDAKRTKFGLATATVGHSSVPICNVIQDATLSRHDDSSVPNCSAIQDATLEETAYERLNEGSVSAPPFKMPTWNRPRTNVSVKDRYLCDAIVTRKQES